jgi:ATP-binding cassette, subfamily B, bacterial
MKPSNSTDIKRADESSGELPPAIRSLWRTFRLGVKAEPKLLSLSLGLSLLMMAPDAVLAVLLKRLVDTLDRPNADAVFMVGYGDGSHAKLVAVLIGLCVAATWFLSVLSQRAGRRFRDRIAVVMESHVANLQASVPTIEHHERPEYLDRLAMLRDQVFTLDHLFQSLFSTLGWIFRLVITVALLMSVHPLLGLLILCALPAVYTSTWRPAIERKVEESVISNVRLSRHLFVLGTTSSAGKEVRVTGTGRWLAEERRAAWDRSYQPIAATRLRTALWHAGAWAVFGLGYVGAIVFVTSRLVPHRQALVVTGSRSVGAVVLVVAAGLRLGMYVGATAGELGFLRGFWMDSSKRLTWLEDYAAAADRHADTPAPTAINTAIVFEHVSFRYPGTPRLVLDDVSLSLPAGNVVAVVGENGAGKSTLVKLLARMYEPTSGRITVDGIDIATIRTDEWRQRLAGAFQDFYRFEFHAQHTVGFGDLPRLDERSATETAIDRAGAHDVIDRLAYGLDTQLGPTWDGGAEVSFGQWQKLALARGFMQDDPLLLILDEPTAALDAETEHSLFERFASASRAAAVNGRIVLLVSHRFSTVRMADLIVVMDGSRIAEFGSHADLMIKNGMYAELFRLQASAYAE